MKSKPKFIISGGGTGGHIYPAIAIANEIKAQIPQAEILFVGAKDKMEMQKVPAAGYPIKGLWISGLQRKLTFQNLMFPVKFISSLWKSKSILKEFKPDVVIGTGGFASGSIVKVAADMGIPTIVQEQNSYPGLTNKMLSKKAKAICVAYDGLEDYFPKGKIVKTGNPVRQDILRIEGKKEEGQIHFGLDVSKKTLVILGGSLGARRINQLVEKELDFFLESGLQIVWQCGKLYFEEYKKYNDRAGVQVLDFIDRMDLLFASADYIVSRAGASSVSELSIVGKPVLFIPSPNVAADHQTKNAQSIADQKGAILISEKQLENTFTDVFSRLIADDEYAKELSENLKKLALPNATKDIVKQIMKYIS